jgi:hypothetical protein
MESPPREERVGHRRVRLCGAVERARMEWNRKRKTREHRDPETADGKEKRQRSGTGSVVQRWGSEEKAAPAGDRNRRRREERKSRGKRCPVHDGPRTCGDGGLMSSTHKFIRTKPPAGGRETGTSNRQIRSRR